MAASRRSVWFLLLLSGCALTGQQRTNAPLTAAAWVAEGSAAPSDLPVPPSGRALARREPPASAEHPEDARLRLPGEMRLAPAETVQAERLGRVHDEGDRKVIVLTPMPCRILEQEASPGSAADREGCRLANQRDFAARSQQVWTMRPGRYTVRVANSAVDWPVGLWIRSTSGLSVAAAGGGAKGEVIEVDVELGVGDYLVSLPLLPTPDYLWQVRSPDR